MTKVAGTYLIIEDFNYFPVGLEHLDLKHCIATPSNLSSAANDGFNPDGTVNWPELFSIVWNLQSLFLNDCRLRGAFPLTYPPGRVSDFQVTDNQLTGTIAPTFFSTWSRRSMIQLWAVRNQLTGTLPPELFDRFKTSDKWLSNQRAQIEFSDNLLTGSIPPQWLPADSGAIGILIYVARNQLTGTIPEDILPDRLVTYNVVLDLSSNRLSGTIPPRLFYNSITNPNWLNLRLDVSNNNLNGSLPSALVPTWTTSNVDYFSLNVSRNQLTGTIPPALVAPDRNVSFGQFYLNLDHNLLSGTIPEQLIWTRDNTTGNIRTATFRTEAALTLDANQLEGTIPPKLLTYFTGPSTAKMLFSAMQNQLSGTIPPAFSGDAPLDYLVSLNPKIVGTIPPSMMASLKLVRFEANGTGLTGDLPPFTSFLKKLDLSNTKVSFCSGLSKTSIANFYPSGTCLVYGTSACGCSDSYSGCASCCTGEGPENSTCVDGAWVFSSDFDALAFSIPRTSTPVVILGNLNVTQLLITGIGSTIIVKGSVFNLTTLSPVLEKDDLKELGRFVAPLLTIEGGDANSSTDALKAISVRTRVRNSCRAVNTTYYTEGRTLYGVFVVSKGSCDHWWIITASVIGGSVVLLAVVALILVLTRKSPKPRPKSSKSAFG